MKKPIPDVDYLLKVLDYNSDTGIFTWKPRKPEDFKNPKTAKVFNSKHAGNEAGNLNPDGYIYIHMCGTLLVAHRIAWKILTGKDPINEIDHINLIRNDNRACNLREADGSQNRCNTGMRYNNNTGLKGAVYDPKLRKYRAAVGHRGKKYYLGLYSTAEAAHAAYREKALELHTEFTRF